MIDNLYTQRSYAKCISEGYKFLADNLWMITKVMWLYFLVVSALMVVFNGINTYLNVADAAGGMVTYTQVTIDFALLLLVIVAYIVAIRRLYIMFKRLCGINGKRHININKVCKAILRHCGKIIGTSLLSLFGVIVMSVIVYLPFVIATYTYFSSIEGEVNFGDTTLIPTYGYVIMFLVCTLSYFVINILSVSFYATMVFLYGDIRTRVIAKSNHQLLNDSAVKQI